MTVNPCFYYSVFLRMEGQTKMLPQNKITHLQYTTFQNNEYVSSSQIKDIKNIHKLNISKLSFSIKFHTKMKESISLSTPQFWFVFNYFRSNNDHSITK